MMERRQVVAYVLGSAFVLALVVLGLWRTRVVSQAVAAGAPAARLRVSQVEGHPGRYQTTFETMGTDASLTVVAPGADAARAMFLKAVRRVEDVDRLMSTYLPDSEISRLNRRGSARLSEETLAVIRKAADVSRLSGGAFDITYAPLRTLWRHAAQVNELPSPEELAKVRAAIGYDKLEIKGNEVRFTVPGMQVDLGGIAKGYAADLAAQALQQAGAKVGITDMGGNLRLFGLPPKEKSWHVAIRQPPKAARQYELDLPPCGVSTSGDYFRGYRVQDKWLSHIINPATGEPVKYMSSVTIIAPDAVTADGLSTAVSVMGWPKGMKLVESLPHVECLMMVRQPDGSVLYHQSSGFGKYVEKD